ncbi:hypothetical protein IFR05_016201 [Cadophora sp. M221]|nr:hypothetical protein IFR05_016201 [Cadophora sp. M221]
MALGVPSENASNEDPSVPLTNDTVMEDFTDGEPAAQGDGLNSTLEGQDQDLAVAETGTVNGAVERSSTVTKSPVNSSEEGEDGVSSNTEASTPRSTANGSSGKRTPLPSSKPSSEQGSTESQEENVATKNMTDEETKERALAAEEAAKHFYSEAGKRAYQRGQISLKTEADVLIGSDMLMRLIEEDEGLREERAAKRQIIEEQEAEMRDAANTLLALAPMITLRDRMSSQQSRTQMHLPSPPALSSRYNLGLGLGLEGRIDGGGEIGDADLDLRRQILDRNHHIGLTETETPEPQSAPQSEPPAFDREDTVGTVDGAADDPENNHYHYWPPKSPLRQRIIPLESTWNSHAANKGTNTPPVKRRALKAAQGPKAPKAPRVQKKAPRVQKKAAARPKSGSSRDQQPR